MEQIPAKRVKNKKNNNMAVEDKTEYAKENEVHFSNKASFNSNYFFHGPIKVFNRINGMGVLSTCFMGGMFC
jgi:hypothetical protein